LSEQPVRLSDGIVALRVWEPEDVATVFAACQDPVIARFLPIPQPYTEMSAREFVALRRADWDGDDERSFAITDAATSEVVGAIARHQRAEHRVEFGYWVAPWARGRGFATRALRLVADWSLRQGFIRLELFTHPNNSASGKVAERAGFTFEGVRRAWDTDRDGNPEDGVFYVRLARRLPVPVGARDCTLCGQPEDAPIHTAVDEPEIP
jgi:RimJ/RimL family protein N-acetyltransferase